MATNDDKQADKRFSAKTSTASLANNFDFDYSGHSRPLQARSLTSARHNTQRTIPLLNQLTCVMVVLVLRQSARDFPPSAPSPLLETSTCVTLELAAKPSARAVGPFGVGVAGIFQEPEQLQCRNSCDGFEGSTLYFGLNHRPS